ncbi:hypothetical protein U9M48_010696 [Paspalum notatum var. saurae]|uniref:Uncharacterized protein n=1 Tax=Paspalum notatum var. saurae TaxID=547442 RepID=A0AAQ3SU07_PASNO
MIHQSTTTWEEKRNCDNGFVVCPCSTNVPSIALYGSKHGCLCNICGEYPLLCTPPPSPTRFLSVSCFRIGSFCNCKTGENRPSP